jgi:hypothetical protein
MPIVLVRGWYQELQSRAGSWLDCPPAPLKSLTSARKYRATEDKIKQTKYW